MSILSILYSIFIMPLQLFFEIIFTMANKVINNPGLSIIVLSLAMNFLVLPLYRRADAMQEEERDMEAKLHKGVKHIKKTFKGDERMMILNTYYRQKGYKPTYVFRGAISLFLEIPFFIAAYQFLSHLEILRGVSFGVLQNLGAADGLIVIGNYHINVLPIIMTAVNLVSCVIFTKGYPTKTKVQLYSMAIFFFFFLYSSPSGLVFYWTLNNLFSLVKTIFYKLKNPKRILKLLFGIVGIAMLAYAGLFLRTVSMRKMIGVLVVGCLLILPAACSLINRKVGWSPKATIAINKKANPAVFISSALFLIALVGGLIPSAVINASPQEFVNVFYYSNPLWYVCNSVALAMGTFLVWFGVFYWLADEKGKVYFEVIMWMLCGAAVINYMFFGKNLGIFNNMLKYDAGMIFTRKEQLFNIVSIMVAIGVLYIVYRFAEKYIKQILIVGALALGIMTGVNVSHISASVAEVQVSAEKTQEELPSFTLSKTGKNVVVLMLDRAMNEFIPYMMNEKPELKQMYAGFTYYENTVSFGTYTNFAIPALFGGYEYTPYELNKRNTELLKDKQNEALKVMPVLFDENGYDVTVCDPTYANYQWVPDVSIYDEYPDINAYVTNGRFTDKQEQEKVIKNNRRNFFCYSIMKTLPVLAQPILYDAGNYNHMESAKQTLQNNYIADGMYLGFMNAYTVLENLSNMTKLTDEDKNTFLLMTNDATHETMMLQEPEYVPAEHVDNTAYEQEHSVRTSEDGQTMQLSTADQYLHYQSDMAALLRVGEWLEELKKEGVYDNTRIIIVADHGRWLGLNSDMILQDGELYDLEAYYPLLMVKDFNSKEFTSSDQFMTNADVPTIAMQGLITNPQNPFTGKNINSEPKEEPMYVFGSDLYDILSNNGYAYEPGIWFSVKDDMRDKKNWKILQENAVLPNE